MSGYHDTCLTYDKRRDILWKTLCKAYFQGMITKEATVLELGAGYGHFINHIKCARRIAVDQWEQMPHFVSPNVETHIVNVTNLDLLTNHSIDFVFASNLFEHLTQAEFEITLEQIRFKLKSDGTLNILQPNYRFAYREYFDDYTHISIYSDRSIVDFLSANGFRVIDCKPRFLPLSIKSSLPVSPMLIRMYLKFPIKLLGKQMLIRAKKER